MSQHNGIETRHSYNARNQLTKTTEGEAVREYGYDRRGNLTGITESGVLTSGFTFDATNRMIGAVTGKGRAEYGYNGFLNRVRKLETVQSTDATMPDPLKETRYTLDLTKPYNDLIAIGEQRFIWGDELLHSEGSDRFSYLSDHLGSPIRLMGDSHEEALAYDEFGVPAVEMSGSLHNPFGFTGYQADDVSGLCYAQARYYEPTVGRFGAEDTHWHTENMIFGDNFIQMPHGALIPNMKTILQNENLYGYCINNPIRYIDPVGKNMSCDESDSSGYDRNAAIAYADHWWDNRNPDFYSYSQNCANFASQLLLAGGICMSDEWYSYQLEKKSWWGINPVNWFIPSRRYNWDIGEPWRLANNHFQYFSNPENGYINGVAISLTSRDIIGSVVEAYRVQPGDLLYWINSDGRATHVGMISAVSFDNIYFTANTGERFDHQLSLDSDEFVKIVRIND
jgi:RHS repeat-associated protein